MKKIAASILIICLLLSSVPFATAASVTDFSDIRSGDWYYSAVSFVTDKGMFNGTSANTFSPEGTMTRGMFVTVLGRHGRAPTSISANSGIVTKTDVNLRTSPTTSESPVLATLKLNTPVEIIEKVADSSGGSYMWYKVKFGSFTGYIREDMMSPSGVSFTDVPAEMYYAPYVQWAYSNAIAGKTGESTFSPEVNITREEICSMLYNYAGLKHLALNATVAAKTFSDSGSINSSYSSSVSAMQKIGVIDGYPDGTFKPKNSASRAEVSIMLMRFIFATGYKPVIEASVDANGNYIWGTEVPAGAAASVSYFDDACFIGHSIVVGMNNSFNLPNADFLCFSGAHAKSIQEYAGFDLGTTHTDENGKEVKNTGTLAEAIKKKTYGKVYIMLGTNEVGNQVSHQNTFYSRMSALIDMVRTAQPNARIYLFSLTPVSQNCSEGRSDLTRDNIIAFNAVVKKLCKEKKAYYLNVFDLLVDSDGYLPPSAGMSDGIHILSSQYLKIKTYMFSHT